MIAKRLEINGFRLRNRLLPSAKRSTGVKAHRCGLNERVLTLQIITAKSTTLSFNQRFNQAIY